MRNRCILVLPLLSLLAWPGHAWGLDLSWYTLDGGGGTSTAGFLSLSGTIAQTDVQTMAAGSLELRGGFWSVAGETVTSVPEEGSNPILRPEFSLRSSNPSRGHTVLQFRLPRAERTRVRIYDVAGRLVRTLVDGEAQPGIHDLVWNGRDRGGQRVASGVYLVQMQAGAFGATRKVTYLR